MSFVILCKVHFFRGIDNAIGPYRRDSDDFKIMASLLNAPSRDSYDEVIAALQGMKCFPTSDQPVTDHYLDHVNPKVRNWAEHKASNIIAAGLNKNCSLMRPECFENATHNTNASEQTHWKGLNFGGKKQSLLKCIQSYVNQFLSGC